MTVDGITIMPNEFNFKSKANTLSEDIVYHAKRKGISDAYIITWNISKDRVSSEVMYYKKMYGKLKYGEFTIVE